MVHFLAEARLHAGDTHFDFDGTDVTGTTDVTDTSDVFDTTDSSDVFSTDVSDSSDLTGTTDLLDLGGGLGSSDWLV